jgi:hypothetical protein
MNAKRLLGAVLLVAAGGLVGNACPRPGDWPGLIGHGLEPAGGPPEPSPSPREEAQARLTRLEAEGRELHAREQALLAAVKETRLADRMLRRRGSGDDSEACRGLDERRRRLERELGQIRHDLNDTRQDEARLRRLLRGGPEPDNAVIPEEKWTESADAP